MTGQINRGNGYPARFVELIDAMGPHGQALDCGGGDRHYGDPRVINLERTAFPTVDVVGDCLAMQFGDDTFDVVMSQAVLEHVVDPQAAVDEMVRVLAPGGTLYVEVAFMQPLHMLPWHYFNVTPYGLAHLCRGLEVVGSGVMGDFSWTVAWLGRAVGLEGAMGVEAFDEWIGMAEVHNGQLEHPENAANLAWLEGRKR